MTVDEVKNIIKAPLNDIFIVIKHWKWNGNLPFARHYNWVLGNLSNAKGEKVTCIQKIIVSDYNRLFSNISLALYSWKKKDKCRKNSKKHSVSVVNRYESRIPFCFQLTTSGAWVKFWYITFNKSPFNFDSQDWSL